MTFPAETITQAIAPLLPGLCAEVLPQVDSTNTELMRRARAGRMEPVLLVALEQTAGRGRLGRGWLSQGGDSLTFSLGLPLAPADWSGLSLAVGVSVAGSLHPDIRLKWPNDLWLTGPGGDRKLGGILIETASSGQAGQGRRYAVIGVGINLCAPPTEAGADALTVPAAGLRDLVPGIDTAQALHRVAAPLVQAVLAFAAHGFGPFQARFNALDALFERAVVLSDGSEGTAHGVDESGALQVLATGGMRRLTSTEVSVRPAAPGPQ